MIPHGFEAATQIMPSRFVKLSVTHDSKIDQAGAGDFPIGVSAEWAKDAPIPSETTGDAAASGESIAVYGVGDICKLELGGTVQVGSAVKSDANGKGVAGTLGTDHCGGFALESGVSGGLIRLYVLPQAT